jgi:uncharacterized membrane protein YdjX (TVP38/TMEM64 family)
MATSRGSETSEAPPRSSSIDDGSTARSDLKPAGILAALGLYAVAAPPLGLALLLAASPRLDPVWAEVSGVVGLLVAVLLGTALVGSALLPSIGFAGYVGYVMHGDPWAYVVVVASLLGATHVGLAWARRLSSSAAQQLLRSRPNGQRTLEAMEHDSGRGLMGLVFMSRLSPHMPFAFTNILVAQIHQPLTRLALVSTLGLLPRSFLAVIVGGGLRSASDWSTLSLSSGWTWIITAVVVLYFARLALKAYRSANP